MDVRTCKICGKMYNYNGGMPLCNACKEELENKFAEVKEYIYANRQASMQDIARDNDVPIQQIKQWVREERLIFSEDSPIMLQCEMCGANIRTGRFCDKCKHDTARGFGAQLRKKEEPKITKTVREKERMRFLDK